MRPPPLTVDGLWYCLCPSFRPSLLRQAVPSLQRPQKVARRCLNTESASPDLAFRKLQFSQATRPQSNAAYTQSDSQNGGHDRWLAPESDRHHWQKPEPTLEERLEEQSARRRTEIPIIAALLRQIFRHQNVAPNSQHYKALILANIDRKRGSSEHVRALLREMEAKGITADSATLHAALETLAVHPDYILRQEILAALRTRWLSLSPAGWHHLAAGLIREGQLELALNRIDLMEVQGIRLEQWLHNLLIYNLCAVEEYDEVLRLMRRRGQKTSNVSRSLWIYLLNKAIRASHLNLGRFAWINAVDLSYARVDVSHCRQILELASRNGDTQLSESAFRQIVVLEEQLSREDYEQLVRAYAKAGDSTLACEILCRMQGDGFSVRPESTSAVLVSLQDAMMHPAQVWKTITDLKLQKLKIPVGLASMAIEYCDIAMASGQLSDSEAVELALDIYKDIFDVCSGAADTHTYNILFALCRRAKRADAFTFIAREMAALKVDSDPTTLETSILVCLEVGNYHSAYMYALDYANRGWKMSAAVSREILGLCAGTSSPVLAILRDLVSQ